MTPTLDRSLIFGFAYPSHARARTTQVDVIDETWSLIAAHRLHLGVFADSRPSTTEARTGEIHQGLNTGKEDRGFASMDRTKQREIASQGGKAAHVKGTAHEWSSEEAREAGRKGGMASRRKHQQEVAQESVPANQRIERIDPDSPLRQDWWSDF